MSDGDFASYLRTYREGNGQPGLFRCHNGQSCLFDFCVWRTFRTCHDVRLESVMCIKADIAYAYPGSPANLPPCGGALVRPARRERASAGKPNSEQYMSAACLRTIETSGFVAASPYLVLMIMPFMIGSLACIFASASAAIRHCPKVW